jgi:hypothetical protein
VRRKANNHAYAASKYRKSLPHLLKETGDRCTYSLQHVDEIGMRTMEVDHFNPTFRCKRRHWHGNLMAATRHCNGNKGDAWPTAEEQADGCHYLDPYECSDYGDHIREDEKTGELVGITRAGRYHLTMLDLNADHLVKARLRRTKLRTKVLASAFALGNDDIGDKIASLHEAAQVLEEEILSISIPRLPLI